MTTGPRKTVRADPARQVALDVIRDVSEHDAYANLLLPQRLRKAGLAGRDAAFATELTYGTLRWQGTYDVMIEACVDASSSTVEPMVHDLLRLGAHQLFHMNVPPHAAVATTVELAKANRLRRAAGFVNAVLRRLAGTTWQEWTSQLTADRPAGADDDLGIRHAHPTWLVAELRRALAASGHSETELEQLLEANNTPANVTLVARPGRSSVAELLDAAPDRATRGRWSPYAVVLSSGDPADLPAVRERRAGVQDEGSQLVASALAQVPLATDVEREQWLDMCAGPGGKAALLAALAEEAGADLEAWELKEHRAALVRQQVGHDVRVRTVDAADRGVVEGAAGTFDRVLLDAPCSGAGALRRRPEARWRKSASDLPGLVEGQRRLLGAAARLVRPGGVIAYVTCSPLVDETVGVVDAAVTSIDVGLFALAAVSHVPQRLAELAPPAAGSHLQLWPHIHGTDAMFLALLRRHA